MLNDPNASRVAGRSPIFGLVPGMRLGRYEILGEIGSGGMAVVYRARDMELDRIVALKVLPHTVNRDDRFVSRFLSEARTIARLSHPNIVQVHDIGQDNGAWYISMEMITGINLAEYLQQEKPDLQRSVKIAQQVAEAIAYTHQHGVMHRDLKPSNVLMRDEIPVVIDFGLAKDTMIQAGSLMTQDGEMVGSPAYMSPEQASGIGIDQSTDICSLGIVLYELISFKNPYLDPRSLHQTVMNVLAAEPVPLRELCPWLDKNLDAVVTKAMAKDRADRYATMDAFAKDLLAWLNGTPVSAKPLTKRERLWLQVRKYKRHAWIAALPIVIGLGGAAFLMTQERLSRTPWAPYAEESFSSPSPQITFESFDLSSTRPDAIATPSTSWKVKDNALVGQSQGVSYARSRQDFLGNIRMEFEVQGQEGTNHDFNVFLQGDTPSDGIRFYLGQWGSQRCGIDPSGKGYKWLPARQAIEAGKPYKVAVERDGQTLRLFLNEKLVDERIRVLPPTRSGGYRLGFFTWNGSVAIKNVKVWRRTVALQASPTVVADAFLDEGFLDHAVNAYQAVVQSYPSHQVAQEAQLKMGAVMLSRNQIKQAIDVFEAVLRDPRNKDLQVRADFLRSLAEQSAGNMLEAQKDQKEVVRLDPNHSANIALIQNQLDKIEPCLDLSQPLGFGCASDGESVFRFLAEIQPKRQQFFGPVHARFLEALRLWSGVTTDTAFLRTGFEYQDYYSKSSPEIAGQIRLVQGRRLRDMRRVDEAIALFRDLVEGSNASDAPEVARMATIELGRSYAWNGKPAEAQKWLNQVVDDPNASDGEASQALFELGITTVLSSQDATPRWKAVLDRPTAPWLLRQQAAFLAGKIDGEVLRLAMSTPEGQSHELPLLQALQALQKRDFKAWHGFVEEYVRRYPYSTGLWELRRVMDWASQRTPQVEAPRSQRARG
ncbi:MAG: Serine/threonine-protein kinase PknB [Fibrobacterota bacterium]|jgi:serine/threonine protein kinase/tetratricopeptide (TPR) repeat protein